MVGSELPSDINLYSFSTAIHVAARLTVIVSQSALRVGSASDLEESLVAELMMTQGLDATMVGPLERIQQDDTDFLCLSSFNHNLVLVSWLPLADAQQHWQRLDLGGQVIELPTPGQPAGQLDANTASPQRRVYHLQLAENTDSANFLQALNELLAIRSVKTVGISGIGLKPSTSDNGASKSLPVVPTKPAAEQKPKPQETTAPATQKKNAVSPAAETPATVDPMDGYDSVEDADWAHLDKLVDDFESLDL